MASTFYITAGLTAIDSADSPPAGDNQFFMTAGLTANDYAAAPAATPTRRRGQPVLIDLSSLIPAWLLAACVINPKLTRRDWLRPWRWLRRE